MSSENEKLSTGYLASVVGTMLVLPGASIAIARLSGANAEPFRWFVFWAIGARLFTAGIRQSLQPSFTAREIFNLQSVDAEVIVRELGFANICMGLSALVSGFIPSWRPAATATGGLYFGIAGVMHLIKKAATANEKLALISDFLIFLAALIAFFQPIT